MFDRLGDVNLILDTIIELDCQQSCQSCFKSKCWSNLHQDFFMQTGFDYKVLRKKHLNA